jgi:hypothetical protein
MIDAGVPLDCLVSSLNPNAGCIEECSSAVAAKSNLGCEFWAVNMDNATEIAFKRIDAGAGLIESDFTFVVANQSTTAATVEVWRSIGLTPTLFKSVMVPARTDPVSKGVAKIRVPWQSISPDATPVGQAITGRGRTGYKLISSRPITAYQFNPSEAFIFKNTCTNAILECQQSETCEIAPGGTRKCRAGAFSNDSSLLIPVHALGVSYTANVPGNIRTASGAATSYPGQLAILATQDNTVVNIQVKAPVAAGTGFSVLLPTDPVRTVTLNAFEVLQLSSNHGGSELECSGFGCRSSQDLSGSTVTSDKPVAVFAGHPCASVPYDRSACDHLEEQLIPLSNWGTKYVAIHSAPLRLANQMFSASPFPDYFKVVAGADTTLTFTPALTASALLLPNTCLAGTSFAANNCQLAAGTRIEFKSSVAFVLNATAPISVAQFLTGQGPGSSSTDPIQGDPSMILLPPVEQWRTSYSVIAPLALRDNYLSLSIDSNVASVSVDGVTVTGFTPIIPTMYSVKNVPVTPGIHWVNSVSVPGQVGRFGVTVHGYDQYVSHGYLGGMDFK